MDITLGVTWWVVKNAVYGTYCLGSYLFCTTEPPKEDKEMLELKYQIAELNKKLDRISSMNDLTTVQPQQPIENEKTIQNTNIEHDMCDSQGEINKHNIVDIDDTFVLVDE